ncbi:ead/Ea22-like family protein [Citrobacter sp. RHBSTW-01013]|uniref:ead/Ea22-like family protein n=1 Tax=Citrobacter sp. RHBSTW-01013 TaxID=2742677 RepID=UPI0015EA6592|nr:ead/Ea22-like family protein [Citrobacter sp. RHBSTW-01013]QLR23320.1 ead/Ea22-like family protein [Citrobacter sp. RHBSTW-01013]
MTALNKQALREAAQEEIMLRSVSDTSDAWQDEASPEAVLALLDELEKEKGYASAYEGEKWHYHQLAESEGERANRAEAKLEAAEKRIAELEARQPYGYLRENDGQIQISIGSERPHDRSGGYATPWFAIYTAAGIGVKGE